MTEPRNSETSEVDPAVLAGEPDSVHQLEGGDDDLPPLRPEPDEPSTADAPLEGRASVPGGPPTA